MSLSVHLYPSPMLNESRLFRLSASLQASGLIHHTHLVGVLSEGLDVQERIDAGRLIVRIGGGGRSHGFAQKVRRALGWQWAVLRRYAREPVVAVHVHSVWVLPLGVALALVTRAALFYNPHELETATPTMVGLKRRVAQIIERLLIRRPVVVTTVNDSIADWYVEQYGIDRPLSVRNIPVSTGRAADLRARLGIGADELLFIHTGRLAAGRSLDQVLETFRSTQRHIVFLGDGPLGDRVRAAAADSAFIHWLAPVAPEAVVAHVREADVALCLIDTTSLSYRLSSPNKLFEALAAGTPPLCSDLVEARRLLGSAAEDWILRDVATELRPKLEALDTSDIDAFKQGWPGLSTWDEEVAPLVERFASTISGRSR